MLACAVVKVSVASVAAAFVLHTRVVPVGVVPVLGRFVKLRVVVGQELLAVVGVTEGGVVPATQPCITVTFVLHGAVACGEFIVIGYVPAGPRPS